MTTPVTYWTCHNGHVVFDHYTMPHSGTKCNVVGCGGTREQVSDEVDDLTAAAIKVTAHLATTEDHLGTQVYLEQLIREDLARSVPDAA